MTETAADTIRRAAALMRHRAQAAPTSPWHAERLGDEGYPQRISNPRAIIIAQTYSSPTKVDPTCDYIAALHPDVALHIADAWDATAEDMANYEAVEHPKGWQSPGGHWLGPNHLWTATIRAARAYVGDSEPRTLAPANAAPTDPCPHCPDGHDDPNTKPWAVWVTSSRLDGQPPNLCVAPTDSSHVAESDAEWLRQAIRDAKSRRHAPLTDEPSGVIPTPAGRAAVLDYRTIQREVRPHRGGGPT